MMTTSLSIAQQYDGIKDVLIQTNHERGTVVADAWTLVYRGVVQKSEQRRCLIG